MKCNKEIFLPWLKEYRPCIREKGHDGRGKHSPDMTGIKFGSWIIEKPGKPYTWKRRDGYVCKFMTWIALHEDGCRKTVRVDSIMSGHFRGKETSEIYGASKSSDYHSEYHTVVGHHKYIFHPGKRAKHCAGYKDMPFCDDWNPDKGGAFWKGVRWIVENLGPRPDKNWSLDIVDHVKGFVPGNLRWACKRTQKANQQHRTLGQFTDEEFLVEARKRGFTLVAPSEGQICNTNQ